MFLRHVDTSHKIGLTSEINFNIKNDVAFDLLETNQGGIIAVSHIFR